MKGQVVTPMRTYGLRFDVNCSILFTELPVLQRARAARDAGFRGVEFWWPWEAMVPSDGEADAFVRSVKDAGVELVSLNFHTGDMATFNEEGYLLIVDRKKDIIVSGGENISSLEVEKAILAHPAVLEAAVIPVPDEKWGEVPKALVVLKPNAVATEPELIEFCRSGLAHYKCPRSFEFLDSLPKTGTGKILKKDIRRKYWQGQDTLRPSFASPARKSGA